MTTSEGQIATSTWSAELGARLKQARIRAGKTQKALADELKVSQPLISNWERGVNGPDEAELSGTERILGFAVSAPPSLQESESATDLGLWLRNEIQKKQDSQNKTIATIAAEAGLSVPTLYNIMNGAVESPQGRTLKRLQEYFGAPPDEVGEEAKVAADVGQLGQFSQFEPHDDTEWPTGPGVYVLYDAYMRPTYIGKSQESVATRLGDHQTRFWYKHPLVAHGAYVSVTDPKLVLDIENLLIKVLGSLAVINQKGVVRDPIDLRTGR